MLRQSLSLCQSLLQREERLEAAYFEAVRTLLTRVEGKGKISFREINERINELLKQSIKSEGVINLFSDIKEEFSIFDPKFLEEIAQMKQKNFAVELLRKLIAEQIKVYQRTNTVRAEKFSEILANAMSNYLKGGEQETQPFDRGVGILRCYNQTRGGAGFLYQRATYRHYTRTDRCTPHKQDY